MASGGGMANRSGEKAWCCKPTRRALLVGPGSAALTSVRPGRRGGGTGGVAAEGFERVAGSAATAPGDAARASADLLGYDTSDFRARAREKIGRASCRERVCQYV